MFLRLLNPSARQLYGSSMNLTSETCKALINSLDLKLAHSVEITSTFTFEIKSETLDSYMTESLISIFSLTTGSKTCTGKLFE